MVAKVQSQRGRCEVMDKRKECKEVPWGREGKSLRLACNCMICKNPAVPMARVFMAEQRACQFHVRSNPLPNAPERESFE